jgi:predicted hotdog family 3-hydroxylacyl-ACP dehydratase
MIGLVDKAGIAALIPHAGPMCLLDAVLAWDMTTIACVASSHRSAGNPLAANDRLDAVCGVEYASQAMAVHAGLIGNGRHPTSGYLASLREVICSVERLDLLDGDLLVTAELLIAQGANAIYRFELICNAKSALSGRAAVVIDPGHLE